MMMLFVAKCLLGLVGLIHLLPASGLFSAAQLQRLYAVGPLNDDLVLLLRHRALLFGLLGIFAITATWQTRFWWPAAVMNGISIFGFILLAWPQLGHNTLIDRVFYVDIAAIVALVIACLLFHFASGDPA
jgi:hypothetical protein